MHEDNFFLGIAFFVLVFSLVGFFSSYNNFIEEGLLITGNAVDSGLVNVTVMETVLINFTTESINFGSGAVDEGESSALINTWGVVENGSWDNVSSGLALKNEGNVNVSLNLTSYKSANTFIGGTNPEYKFKIDNLDEDACSGSGEYTLNETFDAGSLKTICDLFVINKSISVDVELIIPNDSNLGILSDTVVVVVSQT